MVRRYLSIAMIVLLVVCWSVPSFAYEATPSNLEELSMEDYLKNYKKIPLSLDNPGLGVVPDARFILHQILIFGLVMTGFWLLILMIGCCLMILFRLLHFRRLMSMYMLMLIVGQIINGCASRKLLGEFLVMLIFLHFQI